MVESSVYVESWCLGGVASSLADLDLKKFTMNKDRRGKLEGCRGLKSRITVARAGLLVSKGKDSGRTKEGEAGCMSYAGIIWDQNTAK